jgi:hypothetical protein
MKRLVCLLCTLWLLGMALADKSPPRKGPDSICVPVTVGQATHP